MRGFAYIYGIIFLVIGIAGFVPGWVVENHLIETFRVNTWLNTIHLISGVYAFIVGFSPKKYIRSYFQVIGIFYGVFAIFGFVYGENDIFGVIANNASDTWFHVILAVAALILGFGARD